MHKGIILLTKAENRDEALSNVREFLEDYEGKVWDWYQIGGRWSNMLCPISKQFNDWSVDFLFEKEGVPVEERESRFGVSQKTVDANQAELQAKWQEMGGQGNSPYFNHYKLPKDGDYYDVMPLSDCLETVKNYCADLEKETETAWNRMLEEKAKEDVAEKKYSYPTSAYYAKEYYNQAYGNFFFDRNVFDIEQDEAESIPSEIKGYWAVMVDIHN